MELPKNVTQIGECDRNCRIYAEDYVMSYLKQLNKEAQDAPMAAALYGVQKQEAGVTFLFLYGACRLGLLKRESRQLSQAQLQEIENLRQQHFSEYEFLGYRVLDGEMIEGFHVYGQGICRYIAGYAQFYEKNDSMLTFMLEERQEVKPEEFHPEKYRVAEKKDKVVPHRVSARALGGKSAKKVAAAAVIVLCFASGLTALGSSPAGGALRETAGKVVEELQRQRLPDAVTASASDVRAGTIVTEDKLTEALQKENAQKEEAASEAATLEEVASEEAVSEKAVSEEAASEEAASEEPEEEASETTQETENQTDTSEAEGQSDDMVGNDLTMASAQETAVETATYTIQKGDTLSAICVARYGDDRRVSEVCSLNGITNPDDIKTGQKILLP